MNKRFHYAWVICAACTLMIFCNMGLACNTPSVYFPYIVAARGFSGAQTSAIITIRNLTAVICLPMVTGYYKRFSLRLGGALAFCITALAFVLYASAEHLFMYYAASVCTGLAYSLGTTVGASLLVERWFADRRGFAIGVALAGSGVASFAFPPLISFLVENFSMRVSFLTQGAIALCCGLVFFLIVRNDPAQMGLAPYEQGGEGGKKRVRSHPTVDLPKGRFLLTCAALAMLGSTSTGAPGHYTLLATTNGVAPATASMAVSAAGLCLMIGKFVYGDACDKLGGKRGSTVFMTILATGCFICSTMHGGIVPLVFAGIMCCGSGFAPATAGMSIWASDFFTAESFPARLKWYQTMDSLGGLICSVIPGVLYDLTGSYNISYVMFGCFVLASMFIIRSTYNYMEKAKAGAA